MYLKRSQYSYDIKVHRHKQYSNYQLPSKYTLKEWIYLSGQRNVQVCTHAV